MSTPITWFEIGSDRPAEAEKFYGDLFGWTFEEQGAPGGSYRQTTAGGEQGIGGAIRATDGTAPSYAIFYAEVADVAETCRRAVAAGARKDAGLGRLGDRVGLLLGELAVLDRLVKPLLEVRLPVLGRGPRRPVGLVLLADLLQRGGHLVGGDAQLLGQLLGERGLPVGPLLLSVGAALVGAAAGARLRRRVVVGERHRGSGDPHAEHARGGQAGQHVLLRDRAGHQSSSWSVVR